MAKFKDLVGLIVLFIVICAFCAIGYVAYSIANDVATKTQEKMEKKNIKVSRDGLKVGLKQVSSEQVADSTQG
jgi:anionic cell wall polymer biosynthesis LytR-Cps2A-Psr (LCP) family protein